MKKYLLLTLFLVTLFGCKSNKNKVDISKINLNVELIRFDKDILGLNPDTAEINKALPYLRKTYAVIFELYNESIIGVGNSYDSTYAGYLCKFLTNSSVQKAGQGIAKVFNNDNGLNTKLTDAFKHFKYYFPDKIIPKIYAFTSGFYAESVILTDSLLGVCLDKYLGSDFDAYKLLGISQYLTKNMYKEKIPSDCVKAWAIGEFPLTDNDGGNNLISKMVYEGKLIHFVKQMMPNEADTVLWGFTKEQLEWCEANKKDMWTYLVEHKLLFSTDRMTIIRLTETAPFTNVFSEQSPGRACNWLGYQIVERYLEKNPDITLAQLMADSNHQKIYENTRYKP